ncbi:MAG TPA: CocE/NonD family hydrolase [Candidatus Acidoferrales bacterium]|nr:CocE/NonD family hydrolase [Candidatus Acidoferrales bacterium]
MRFYGPLFRSIAIGAALVLLPLFAAAQTPDQKPAEHEVDITWAQKIPLRDGVKLNATLYRPHDAAPSPAIFTLTPYIGDTYHPRAMYFAQHGYVFLLVDVRGRGNSGGDFEPFANEGRDGYDVVEWIAKQPWCNGKVTMWGGSYAGFDQWSTLKEFPPHLATIVPAAAAHPGVDFPAFENIPTLYLMQWLTFTSGLTGNDHLFGEGNFWHSKDMDIYRGHLAFSELDRIVGNPSPVFHKWLAHPTADAYFNAMVPTAADYHRISIPILTITGDYDGDQAGALTYYRRHMKDGSQDAISNHYLIIGPWDHAGTRTPNPDVGGLHFGPVSMLDLNKLHTEWYGWTMQGGPKPEFLKKRVAYYVTGAEEWKYADTLDGIATGKRTLYLASNGFANDVFHSGSLLEEAPTSPEPDHFVYDPLDTRPGEVETEVGGLVSQADALNLFGAGLVYHTEALSEATEISGFVKLSLWISMDVPDTDLAVGLYEILPDGRSVQLTGDVKRARYRESLTEAKLVTPGKIERYDFDGFTWFSRRIAKGSRLRIVVEALNSPDSEKNYNSGGAVENETVQDARTAHITLYHDAQHPSVLEVPIVK